MKKLLICLLAVIGFVTIAEAQTRYSVTITTQVIYRFYDENGHEVGHQIAAGTAQTINIWASTPYEAERAALEECSSMCKYSSKNEGLKIYNNRLYQCYSEKVPYNVVNVVATKQN